MSLSLGCSTDLLILGGKAYPALASGYVYLGECQGFDISTEPQVFQEPLAFAFRLHLATCNVGSTDSQLVHKTFQVTTQAQSWWALWSPLEGSLHVDFVWVQSISQIRKCSSSHFTTTTQVMDCHEYGGLPQRRPRLWIVGTNTYATKSTLASKCGFILDPECFLCRLVLRKVQMAYTFEEENQAFRFSWKDCDVSTAVNSDLAS